MGDIIALIPLLQTLLWVLLIAGGAFWLRKPLNELVEEARKRIALGGGFQAGPFRLEPKPELKELSYAPPGEASVKALPPKSDAAAPDLAPSLRAEREEIYATNRGLFLTHVIRPSPHPQQLYDIYLYLMRHKSADFSDVEKAEFYLGKYFYGDKVITIENTDGVVGMRTAAYGPFLCICRVTFRDKTQVFLQRYVDFEMGDVFTVGADSPPQLASGLKRPRGR